MPVQVPAHPLIQHYIAQCRDERTAMVPFRHAMQQLGLWLTYEACRDWLPVRQESITTPTGAAFEAAFVDVEQPVELVPILRAGLALVDGALSALPSAKILHVGYRRDEETARAYCYLTGLPEQLPNHNRFLVLEPMLATGGTLIQVMEAMTERGARPEQVRVISLIASRTAIEKIEAAYPGVQIFCAGIDPDLNEKFYIIPGLGDAGDRAFGTE